MTPVTLVRPAGAAGSRTRPKTGAELLCDALEERGVSLMFGYPGGAAMPLYCELPNHPRLRHILIRHEQNAAMAADGFARASGRPGVCVATSGPGATNGEWICVEGRVLRLGTAARAALLHRAA